MKAAILPDPTRRPRTIVEMWAYIADARNRLKLLEAIPPLGETERAALRVMLRERIAKGQRRELWRHRWQRWTSWQRVGAVLAGLLLLVTLINQVAGFIRMVILDSPHP